MNIYSRSGIVKFQFFNSVLAKNAKGDGGVRQECSVCQEQEVERAKPPGLMGSSPKVTLPFEVLCTDLIVQLPRSTKGNTCLLVTVDLFSKFVS